MRERSMISFLLILLKLAHTSKDGAVASEYDRNRSPMQVEQVGVQRNGDISRGLDPEKPTSGPGDDAPSSAIISLTGHTAEVRV